MPSGANVTKAALTDYCRRALQKRDIPEIFQMLAEIPKTILEKPIERACIDLLRADGRLDG